MTEDRNNRLIVALSDDLTPIQPLAPPDRRALGWLVTVAATALGLAALYGTAGVTHRLVATSDMWLAVAGSTLTAVLAAVAAFHLSLPDRSRAWALLPLPAAAIWIAASGAGCLRTSLVPDTTIATPSETQSCLIFILGLSLPLSAVLILMLRRGFSMQPNLTAAIGGLACAAAAATLLNFIHPFDASATDLGVHALTVAAVIFANRMLGGRLLAASQMQGTL